MIVERKRIFIIGLICIVFAGSAYAQRPKIQNLPTYDKKWYHFGFTLGLNQMNFVADIDDDLEQYDSLLLIEPIPEFGFNIGIVANLSPHNNVDIRFVPTLAFGDRSLRYNLVERDSLLITKNKTVESTYIEFPIYLKLKSNRINNWRVYVIGGFKYGLDMASNKNREGAAANDLLKLEQHDFSWEVGTGLDFYLDYFKLGVEFKMSTGFTDLLDRDGDIYTESVNSLKSKMFWLCLTFE